MKLLTVFKDAIKEYSGQTLSKYEIPLIIEDIIDSSFDEAIKKTRIPKPPGPIEIMIEEYQFKRRSKRYRKTHHPIDYGLWYALYHAKLELTNTSEASLQHQLSDLGLTTSFEMVQADQSAVTTNIHDVTLSDSSRIEITEGITYFDIGSELENRILLDSTVASFVACVEETCRTRSEELSHMIQFSMNEKQDKEIPNWTKLILNIKFKNQKLEDTILEWEILRKLIDDALDKLKEQSDINKEKLESLRKNFYIKLLPSENV